MKITTFIIMLSCLQLSATVYSQNISVKEKEIRLESLLEIFQRQSGYSFFYKLDVIRPIIVRNIDLQDVPLKDALTRTFQNQQLSFAIIEKTVVIRAKTLPVKPVIAPAQQTIVGTVKDDQGKGLPGVSIRVKGTEVSSISNPEGVFVIVIPNANDQILIFSYIGYLSQELHTKDMKNPVAIRMKQAINDLDQVQVLAYSTTSRRNNTGSTYTIKAEEISKNPVPNVLQIIQNRVPGVFITQNTGQPGGSFSVQIRGINGTQNVDPLYIVDGVPFPAGGTNGDPQGRPGQLPILGGINNTPGVARGGNALNYLNPADIESIDVLKDADATSIYGSRGAYGVILITTKKAKAGKPSLSLNLNSGISVRGTAPQLLNTQEYLMLRREALRNDNMMPTALDVDINGTYPEDRYTNWVEEFTGRAASTTRLNANYSGGSEQTSYLLGLNYNNQQDVQSADGAVSDYGMRINLVTKTPDQKLSVNFNGTFNSTVNDRLPYDFSGDNGLNVAPNAPSLYKPDGSLNWETGSNAASARNLIYDATTNNLLGSANLNYKPINGLTINAVLGYNLLMGKEFRGMPVSYYNPSMPTASVNANSILNNYSIRTWSVDPNVRFDSKLGRSGRWSATLGGTLQDKLSNTTRISGSNFASDALLFNPASAPNANKTSTNSTFITRYLGVFGILSYNWDSKYFINLNGRYDGSTKFGEGNRFGTFGSAALAYIFTKENWVRDELPWLSFGKLRASYGTAGGDGISNYQFLSRYQLQGEYGGKGSLIPSALANANLHWESNVKRDVGISLGFLKDRILIDANYYRNTTSDQLVAQPLSSITGFEVITLNSPAVIENFGYELSLTAHLLRKNKLNWTLNANITIPKSKLVSFPSDQVLTNADFIVGQPITIKRLYKYAGVDPQTGLYHFINAAGVKGSFITLLDPVTLNESRDKTEFVDLGPKFFGNLTNTLNYGQLSLDFTFSITDRMGQSYLGQQVYLAGALNQNVTTAYLDRWQAPGDVTTVPRAVGNGLRNLFSQNNFRESTGAYERALYARLQNVSVSYTFKGAWLQRLHIKHLNVVCQGQNLLTISKYNDLDPQNLSATAMPPLRVFNLGLNLNL